jgi:hypothetical protein
MKNIGANLAKAQITNGGPIILVQPENEYTQATNAITPFPDPVYMEYIYGQLRGAGIVVPFISNDASAKGDNAPGQPAAVDIYGHDGYPLVREISLRTTSETCTDVTPSVLGFRLCEPGHLARRQPTFGLARFA